jgi:LysR family nitrogen assimilation transcriptional regulator
MDVRQLEYFMHVANLRNITHAASSPALSRRIRLLEEEVSARLFERKAHGVVPTEAGKRLQVRAVPW